MPPRDEMRYLPVSFSIKAVNPEKRTIEGHASVFDTIDRVQDIVDRKAFDRTLAEKQPADIGVFIGHDMSKLPVGIPLEVRPDGKGLFTKTLVKPTAEGDELLGTAKFLHEHGQPLGMSIGYYTRKSAYERHEGKSARRLLDIDLGEYSYAAKQAIAHPDALTTAVKTLTATIQRSVSGRGKALSEGGDVGGGFLVGGAAAASSPSRETKPYHVEKRSDGFCVVGPTGKVAGCHPTRKRALAQQRALYANVSDASTSKSTTKPDGFGLTGKLGELAAKAMGGTQYGKPDAHVKVHRDEQGMSIKAVWGTSKVNDLPDSAFLYVEPGGTKDGDGKTTPRSLRHFPVRDSDGKVDEAHVRNALGRIPQSTVPASAKASSLAKAKRLAKQLGIDVSDDGKIVATRPPEAKVDGYGDGAVGSAAQDGSSTQNARQQQNGQRRKKPKPKPNGNGAQTGQPDAQAGTNRTTARQGDAQGYGGGAPAKRGGKAADRWRASKAGKVPYERIGQEVASQVQSSIPQGQDDDDDDQDEGEARPGYVSCYPVATYANSVVVCYSDHDGDDDDGEYWYDVPYTLGDDGHVASVGAPVAVDQSWIPVASKNNGKALGATLVRLDALLRERKAGAVMSKTHLGQLHDALKTLRNLHDSQCKDDDCPHRMAGGAADGASDDGGDDGGGGDGKILSLTDWERKFATLATSSAAAARAVGGWSE